MKDGSNWGPKFGVYGDFGNANAQSMGRLQEEVAKGNFDAILHVGKSLCQSLAFQPSRTPLF